MKIRRGEHGAGDARVVSLFDEHYGPLVNALTFMTNSADDAQEIAQEAFTRFLVSQDRVKEDDKAAHYLRSIAFNLARNGFRKQATIRKQQPLVLFEATQQSNETPEAVAQQSDTNNSIKQALQQLPERQRLCIVLRYYMELSVEEAADTLQISSGSVKTHTSRAMEQLRTILKWGEEDGR